MTTKEAMQYVV